MPIFSENELVLADLSELTEADLKETGLPLGPRRRILKAIRALNARDRVSKESTGDDMGRSGNFEKYTFCA